MKKFFPGLAVTAGTLSLAQEKAAFSASPVRFGLKAGLNIVTISGSDSKVKAGFYGGAFANIPLASNFNVQPQV